MPDFPRLRTPASEPLSNRPLPDRPHAAARLQSALRPHPNSSSVHRTATKAAAQSSKLACICQRPTRKEAHGHRRQQSGRRHRGNPRNRLHHREGIPDQRREGGPGWIASGNRGRRLGQARRRGLRRQRHGHRTRPHRPGRRSGGLRRRGGALRAPGRPVQQRRHQLAHAACGLHHGGVPQGHGHQRDRSVRLQPGGGAHHDRPGRGRFHHQHQLHGGQVRPAPRSSP